MYMKFDPNTHYKLMILYLLNKVAFMLNDQQIMSFFNETEYADFFKVHELLNDLTKADLIELYTTKTNQKYKLTDSGRTTLKYFKNELSKNEIESLDKYIKNNKLKMRTESSLTSDYTAQNDSYTVRLVINDNDKPTLAIELDIPDEEVAMNICEHWNSKAQTIYSQIIKSLM